MLGRLSAAPLVGWRTLALSNVKARYDERGTDVDVGRITFANFFARVLLDPQGKLNLNDVLAQQKAAAPAAGAAASPASAAASAASAALAATPASAASA